VPVQAKHSQAKGQISKKYTYGDTHLPTIWLQGQGVFRHDNSTSDIQKKWSRTVGCFRVQLFGQRKQKIDEMYPGDHYFISIMGLCGVILCCLKCIKFCQVLFLSIA
jgi:hypothetical protein